MANKMAEVAKLLGVELNEEFYGVCTGTKKRKYKITKIGLITFSDSGDEIISNALVDILCGEMKMEKLPYKPQKGEKYWTYNIDGFCVVEVCWSGWAQEFALLKCGAIFRTKAEAIAARPRIYKELTGREWTE